MRRHLNGHKGHDRRNQQIPQAVEMMVVKTHRVSYEFGVCGVISRPQLHWEVGGRLYVPARSIIPALPTEYDDREPGQYSQTKWPGCRPSRPSPPPPQAHRWAVLRPIRRESWHRVPHSYLAHPQRTRVDASGPKCIGVSMYSLSTWPSVPTYRVDITLSACCSSVFRILSVTAKG